MKTSRPASEAQRAARVASGRRLAERYRRYEFAPLCPCEECETARAKAKPRTLDEKMRRAEREAAGRAKARTGIW